MSLTDQIERLGKLQSDEGVLSLYVSVDPSISYRRDHPVAAAKAALRQVEQRLEDPVLRSGFERERDKALAFLEDETTPESRAVAIFSSQSAELWEAIPLNVRVPTQASFDRRPKIGPLARVADEDERYCAAVLSKEDARLITISLGEVEEERAITDVVPGRHDQGGWSQARYQRHRDFHVQEHIKRALAELENQLASRPFHRLIVAGPVEVTTEFVELLPHPLKDRLIGVVPCSMRAGQEEVMAAVAPAIEAYERREELALLQQISELADAGGRGVLGLQATLKAISEERVRELAVADGVSASGSECVSCGYLETDSTGACPRCQSELIRTEDIIERATERVYAQGGRVEVMFGDPRESIMARGGVGALLRY
jgi:peptide chain release factor subunit 1